MLYQHLCKCLGTCMKLCKLGLSWGALVFIKPCFKQKSSFPYITPGALFRKTMLLDRDFLISVPGLCTESSLYGHLLHISVALSVDADVPTSLKQISMWIILNMCSLLVGACGKVDGALDSRSEGLGFDSQCWPCVEESGKLRIPHCLSPPRRNGYLVHRSKVGSTVAGCCAPTARGGRV